MPVITAIFALANTDDVRTGDAQYPPQGASFWAGPRHVKFWMADKEDKHSKTAAPLGVGKAGAGAGKNKPGTSTNAFEPEESPSSNPGGRYISVAEYFPVDISNTHKPRFPKVNVGTLASPSYLPVEVCSIALGQISQAREKLD
ncbi:MAG: hypothetical protein Q9192_004307 [Flavoplaca navasiana]